MSLDFALTQFYRVLLDDIVLIYDAYSVYCSNKPYKQRSLKEFSEVLADLTDVEAQNFEDIDVKKLSKDQEESVGTIVWDYLHSVLIRYLLDDASQYPFWSAKMRVFFSKEPFGLATFKAFGDKLEERLVNGKLRTMYEGFGPYLVASAAVNIDYLVKTTNNFIYSILSKIPSPPSLEGDIDQLPNHDQHLRAHAKGMIPGMTRAPSISAWAIKKGDKEEKVKISKPWLGAACMSAITTVVSHPHLVTAAHMTVNPLCRGTPWAVAFIKIMTDYGMSAFYLGLKSRLLVNLLPFSSFIVMGIADNILYRNILSVAFNYTDSSSSSSSSAAGGSAMISYMNYGLLSLAHMVPGFFTFLGMRTVSRIVFGCSVHRKHQFQRRKESVDAYMTKLRRKSGTERK